MLLRRLIAAALLGAVAFGVRGQDAFDLTAPARGVYVHLGRPVALDAPGHDDIANIGFIVGERCVAVIDTGGSPRTGRRLRAAIREHTALPICYVINTHVHVDHLLGNTAFREDRPSFVGHSALPGAISRSRDFFLKEYAGDLDAPASEDQIIGPERLVEKELMLDLGHRPIRLHAWPEAHTDCDLTVYDERTATLWTGDLLFRQRLPALDGSIKGWLAVIDGLPRGARLAVPGHGEVTSDLAAALGSERAYLQSLLEGVRRELADGKSMQDAMAHVGTDEKSHWLLFDQVHARNVARAYEELQWE